MDENGAGKIVGCVLMAFGAVVGGIVGYASGFWVAYVIWNYHPLPPQQTTTLIALSLGVCTAVGVGAGVMLGASAMTIVGWGAAVGRGVRLAVGASPLGGWLRDPAGRLIFWAIVVLLVLFAARSCQG